MNRRQFLIQSSLVTAGTLLPFKKLSATTPDYFTALRRDVGYFTERGGTIGWLASTGGLAVVDSQYPESAKTCLKGLQQKTSLPLDLLINTHHHGDHTSGNTVFKPVAEKMVAHTNVPELMKKSAQENDREFEPAYPSTTYAESWNMDIGDETVHARYLGPAHTGGDSVVYFEKANVVHLGDLVFNRMNPYTDRPSGASIHNWIKVLGQVEVEYPSDAIFIFGHGKPEFGVTGKKKDVGVMKNYLSAMVEHVEEGLEQDKSREEIIKRDTLEGFENFLYADWWTLSQNLEIVYAEITDPGGKPLDPGKEKINL